MSTATMYVTIEARITAAEQEALLELIPVFESMVRNRVLSLRGVDEEAAASAMSKLLERVKTAGAW
jgi:hypothetical protein